MAWLEFLFAAKPPASMVGATLVIGETGTLADGEGFLAALERRFGALAVAVAGAGHYAGARPHVSLPASQPATRKLLARLRPARVIVLGAAAGRYDVAAPGDWPVAWINAVDAAVAATRASVVTVASAVHQARLPRATLCGDPLLALDALPGVSTDTAFCERFREFRERQRWVGYFAATGEDEEALAYAGFFQLTRKRMGLMCLAPRDPARYETVYRDAIPYRLPTVRHLRLLTSFVPYKTRVYYIEDAAVLDQMYGCADFVVIGGTLSERAANVPDLVTPLARARPAIVGAARRDQRWVRAAVDAQVVRVAGDADDLARVMEELLAAPAEAARLGAAGRDWLALQAGAAARVLALLS